LQQHEGRPLAVRLEQQHGVDRVDRVEQRERQRLQRILDVGERRGAGGEQRDLQLHAFAPREPGQPLQLLLLDQAAAVRHVLGLGAPLRELVARRRHRERRSGDRRERHRGEALAQRHPISPDVGELGEPA
jgi:hypothetical protein